MKKHFCIISLVIIIFLSTTAMGSPKTGSEFISEEPDQQLPSEQTLAGNLTPLTQFLRDDGSLDLSTGFNGALDPRGFQMSYSPDGSPLFQAKSPLAPANTWHDVGGG